MQTTDELQQRVTEFDQQIAELNDKISPLAYQVEQLDKQRVEIMNGFAGGSISDVLQQRADAMLQLRALETEQKGILQAKSEVMAQLAARGIN